MTQDEFDLAIGRLDRVLSILVGAARDPATDEANRQTLKHHAEDMQAAAAHILKKLGHELEGTPQPEPLEGVLSMVRAANMDEVHPKRVQGPDLATVMDQLARADAEIKRLGDLATMRAEAVEERDKRLALKEEEIIRLRERVADSEAETERLRRADRDIQEAALKVLRQRFWTVTPGLCSGSWEDIWERVREMGQTLNKLEPGNLMYVINQDLVKRGR